MKDCDSLKALFSENIVLKDWDVHVTGKNKVMRAMKIMFDSADKIKVSPVSFFVNSDYCKPCYQFNEYKIILTYI